MSFSSSSKNKHKDCGSGHGPYIIHESFTDFFTYQGFNKEIGTGQGKSDFSLLTETL